MDETNRCRQALEVGSGNIWDGFSKISSVTFLTARYSLEWMGQKA